jgi:hypothetical protein
MTACPQGEARAADDHSIDGRCCTTHVALDRIVLLGCLRGDDIAQARGSGSHE